MLAQRPTAAFQAPKKGMSKIRVEEKRKTQRPRPLGGRFMQKMEKGVKQKRKKKAHRLAIFMEPRSCNKPYAL